MNLDLLKAELKRDEGVRLKPYLDTVGKVTLGIGRNLQDVGISIDEAELMLSNDIQRSIQGLNDNLPWWKNLDDTRKRVMVNMAFNLGIKGLLTFKNSMEMIKTGRYQEAGKNMRMSKWYTQVGQRAERLCRMMETGRDA